MAQSDQPAQINGFDIFKSNTSSRSLGRYAVTSRPCPEIAYAVLTREIQDAGR
jgi:hypothetical protein